ncbi:MAG: HNH endonuclease [Candidatus Heimdallarchaeota archaeon]|nr:HNH endonuclease [Candidatus Heimdallarchaeota archaeon]MCK4769436.1 HNH endonuclease [Candidatus Heimdallarchaeota archaeon]
MLPQTVKSVKDLIFWQYAKVISHSSGYGRSNMQFIENYYQRLRNEEITWEIALKEFKSTVETTQSCAFCGEVRKLSLEKMIPSVSELSDNREYHLFLCKGCNSSKGNKGLYQWYGVDNLEDIPRNIEGKYLKLLYELHQVRGTLSEDNISTLCLQCDLTESCPEGEVLSVFCLEGIVS